MKFNVGDTVTWLGEEYEVLGYAASRDANGTPLIEIAWDNYAVSPTGYLACLTVLKHRLGDAFEVSSNGTVSDWTDGVAYAQRVTGLKVKNPIALNVQSKAIRNGIY